MKPLEFNAVKRFASAFMAASVMLGCFMHGAAAEDITEPVLPATSAENGLTTVKVGFFAFDGYHIQEENETGGITRSGYGYEFLQHIAGYANLKYEYIGYNESWSEMQNMLENGEIDILTSAQKTPEREERFDFSETNIGVSSTMLTVRPDDQNFLLDDFQNWNGMRVGMIEGNSRNVSFADYATEHGFRYETVYFADTELMVAELQSDSSDRRIDAILTSNLRRIDNERVLAQFDTSPFYIMTKKGNTALLDKINFAITQIDAYETGLRTRLMSKYYSAASDGNISFTSEERNYVESMKGETLTALLNPDHAPYSWIENGEMKGIIYDTVQEIIARTGLNIEILKVNDRNEYWTMIENGDIDIRFDMVNSYNLAEYNNCWLTGSYITVPIAMLHLKSTTEFSTAAGAVNRDILDNYAKSMESKGVAVEYYDSIEETVQAVKSGARDAAFMTIDAAAVAVRDDITNKLAADEIFGDEISYAIAVSRNESPLLFSIINKAAASIDENKINEIRRHYTANYIKPFTLVGFFYSNPMQIIVIAAITLALIIMVIILLDFTRRRKKEREYLEKEKEQNVLLKDALNAAEKAGAAKSQFLSRVSHEMRTPLNAIIGFIELAKGADAEQTENYLASSDIAAKQLLNVINDVLDMSSIESGKLKIANSPFNFKHTLTSITNIYGTQCKQKNLSYETKIVSPIDDWLIGDELRINQILMNLLGNAVKFTSEGHIWLTVSQTAVKENKVYLRFEVSDTGCGMSDEMKERLFKPFEQESATTAKKYGGSGLGLSIVKRLTAMMDGTVRVESKQGRGTTFAVDLPFGISEVKNEVPLTKSIDNLHILAVDDEASELDYITQVLTRMDVRFTCANSGSKALAELENAEKANDPYNVCLVDWRMPEMNGFDTTENIRRKYGKDVVVIIISAYDFEQAGEQAKEAGANLFLSKPIFQSSLFDLLMTLTAGKVSKPTDKVPVWDFAGKRILLAEDNVLNQIVAKGYLAKFNVVVDVAVDGQKAVEIFTAAEPGYYNAILMDVQMPIMDGFEATKAIRESNHPEAKTIQIIAQTADAFDEDVTKALAAGMNAHISKPVKPELLAEALYRAFSSNNGKQA